MAKSLPDGSVWFVRTERNALGQVTNEISTYAGGLRTNSYSYSADGIDLITKTNALGVMVSSNLYNANHAVIAHYNAIGELTTYTYNDNQQLTSVTLPTGLMTTNIYDGNGLLSQQIVVGFATNSYTYANDLVQTHTDPRGLTTVNTWDGLNRLTSVTYPEGSCVSNVYTRLDLTGMKDRTGAWTYFGYDALRHKTAVTNALGNVTLYNYCTCGSLDSVLDAAQDLTQFYYDNQGNRTITVYADGYAVTNTYDLLRRIVRTSDSSGNIVTNAYNNQGQLTSAKNSAGTLASYTYDALDRVATSVDANGVSVNTTYDNLNRALSQQYPDNGVQRFGYTFGYSGTTAYTNQIGNVTLYGYDALNRKTVEQIIGGTTNQFAYDGVGDLLTLTDGKNQATSWKYDEFGRVTNKVDAANVVDFVYQYDLDGRLTNRWTPEKGNTSYAYDAVGNRTNVSYGSASSTSYTYDAMNRLTNMIDNLGTTTFGYDAVGELSTAGGLWEGDTVGYGYANRLRTGLSLGAWAQTNSYDVARRLTSVATADGNYGYTYDAVRHLRISRLQLPNTAYVTNAFDTVARLRGTYLARGTDNHVLDGYTYGYDLLGQRTNVVQDFGDMNSSASAGYDPLGELTSWAAQEPDGRARLNEQLGYGYDAAGNLKQRTNNALVQQFAVNNLNQIATISRSGLLTVSGNTPLPASSVTVNGQPALTYGDFTFASSNGFVLNDGPNSFTNIARNYYGTVAVTNTMNLNLPQSVSLKYDANGNLTNDGVRCFAYDAENQLTNVTVPGQWREDYLYDGLNRRRIKRDYNWQSESGNWQLATEIRYVYDGNLPIQERDGNNNPQVTYTRGLDLSGTFQGAGGIGGLLARQSTVNNQPSTAFYHSDGNGNITALMDGNQYIVGRYLYDPFGRVLGKWGTLADANIYRFSSKEWDGESGLYYYLYRFYEPNLQRWVNRDPVNEFGGKNLYGFNHNDPLNAIDSLGTKESMLWQDYWASWKSLHSNLDPSQLAWAEQSLAQGCIGVTTIHLGERPKFTDCYKTKAEAEARQAEMKKKCKCDDPGIFSVHLWNDTGKDGKNPDVAFDSNGKADLSNWDMSGRPAPYNGNGGYNFDFGWVYPNGTIHHANHYNNPDANGDGKGDYFPNYPVTTDPALVYFSSTAEWEQGAPNYYQYGDFNAEVWCVQCQSKNYGK